MYTKCNYTEDLSKTSLHSKTNFEWTTEHQTRFEEIKKLLTEQISNTVPDPNQPFYAMCDGSNFGIGAALLQSHSGTNKMKLISANSYNYDSLLL